MPDAYILSSVRTAVGKFLGTLAGVPSTKLGAEVVREAIARAGIDAERVEDVIMGCVLPAGLGQNPARQAAIWGGVPDTASALTINKVCGSGLEAVMRAAQAIRAGDAEVIVAGGMESMSRTPYLLPDARTGSRLGHGKLIDSMVQDGLWDIYNDYHMGVTGENVAEKYGISREEQDAYAVQSHKKAARAQHDGDFAAEILPISIPSERATPLSSRRTRASARTPASRPSRSYGLHSRRAGPSPRATRRAATTGRLRVSLSPRRSSRRTA